ncbi:hypothetical protein D3C84_815530 [compost metagenome]
MTPDEVASDVTRMLLILIATASPICAPAMATGCVTSWPPSKAGVIIGPQQPGGVPVISVPPSASGPSIGWPGPMMPLV